MSDLEFEKGFAIGFKQGVQPGLRAMRRSILLILRKYFAISELELVTFADKLTEIDNLTLLLQIVQHALYADTLDVFTSKLETYLQQPDA